MEFKDETGRATWEKAVKINDDPYGSGVIRYVEKWTEAMEGKIGEGIALKDCAAETSYSSDTEGITGFMYGCAVGIIAETWKHGEELRRWHNLKTQVRKEGVKANENGSVLNPAILVIG